MQSVLSKFKGDSIDILPAKHGFYLLLNKDMNLILKAIVDEDKVLEKAGKLRYTEPVWTRLFLLKEDICNECQCIADTHLFERICRENYITPVIIPYNCFFALENPELLQRLPDYIFVDISDW
jgi:hypothetical protein